MKRFSLRWILLWPILLTVSIGITALAVYVERSARTDQISAVDDELTRVGQRITDGLPIRVRPDGNDVGGTDAGGAEDVDPAALDTGAPVQLLIDADGGVIQTLSGENPFTAEEIQAFPRSAENFTADAATSYRVRRAPAPNGLTVVSALPLAEVDASIASLRSSLLVGGIVIFLIVGAMVLLIATAVTRPVTRMSRTANKIAAGALDTRIDPPSGSRETADLADDLEQMVHRLTTSLDDATRARDDMQRFLADASHELRTPLTSLKGYSDLYAGDMLGEPGHLDRAMARIGSESERLAQLVGNMLQLSSGDASTGTRFGPVDLADVTHDVVSDLAAGFPGHRITMHDDAVNATLVSGDRERLHQCVLNLVANACQHGGEHVEVVVRVDPDTSAVSISIIDHGDGIDADLADKIFLPFYRGDASRTRDGHGGAGLGLAIVSQIVEQHDGRLAIEATEGGGATFIMTIPATAATP